MDHFNKVFITFSWEMLLKKLWVSISSIDKVFDGWINDMGINLHLYQILYKKIKNKTVKKFSFFFLPIKVVGLRA